MRVIMLGTGAALCDPDRNHSSMVISVRGRNYLFDCGHGATHQLMRAGIDPVSIDVVFLSHLHFDHIADFPYFMLTTWIFNRQTVPVVIGPPEDRRIRQASVRKRCLCQGHPGARRISAAAEELRRTDTGHSRVQARPGVRG